jgi:hypothetical protein
MKMDSEYGKKCRHESLILQVKLHLGLINYHSLWKWGSIDIPPPFVTLARDRGEWSASRPCLFNPKETPPSVHYIGG